MGGAVGQGEAVGQGGMGSRVGGAVGQGEAVGWEGQ